MSAAEYDDVADGDNAVDDAVADDGDDDVAVVVV